MHTTIFFPLPKSYVNFSGTDVMVCDLESKVASGRDRACRHASSHPRLRRIHSQEVVMQSATVPT